MKNAEAECDRIAKELTVARKRCEEADLALNVARDGLMKEATDAVLDQKVEPIEE